MERKIIVFLFSILFTLSISAVSSVHADRSRLNIAQIEKLTNAKGQLDVKENVFKVSVPRNDLSVTVAGVKMVPAMGITSWAAFKMIGNHTMVMGDLVLTEDQVNAVMDTALKSGLAVTALHNHFFWDNPHLMFMHIEGMGNEDILAKAVGKVFVEIKATSNGKIAAPKADINPANTTLNTQILDKILASKGTLANGVYKVTFGRTTQMDGYAIGNAMGVNTWTAFVGSDTNAVVAGDFAMHESELQNVLKTLRKAGIYIVAIHQHMVGENPRILFLHYWGIGNAEHLAKGLRSALNTTSNK